MRFILASLPPQPMSAGNVLHFSSYAERTVCKFIMIMILLSVELRLS